ncbi:MAG: hypothetical protein ACYS4W_01850 [Planctomycetota bacterium]|jgi:hypothetical protein
MFAIDLLKGQGIPEKRGPERIVMAAVTFVVPIVVAMMMLGFYLSDSIAISVQRREIANYEKRTDKLSDAVEMQRAFEKEKRTILDCLSEVSSTVGAHTQWSPILVTVVESMPDSMVLTKLEVDRRSTKRKVPQKDNPEKMVETTVPVTTLRISLCGKPEHDYERAVRGFRDRLRFSEILGPMLEDIRIARDVSELDGREVVSYELNCVFKFGL